MLESPTVMICIVTIVWYVFDGNQVYSVLRQINSIFHAMRQVDINPSRTWNVDALAELAKNQICRHGMRRPARQRVSSAWGIQTGPFAGH